MQVPKDKGDLQLECLKTDDTINCAIGTQWNITQQ